MNIGIIGQGFVGSAIREGLKNFYDVKTGRTYRMVRRGFY